jgi:hypothetical protein
LSEELMIEVDDTKRGASDPATTQERDGAATSAGTSTPPGDATGETTSEAIGDVAGDANGDVTRPPVEDARDIEAHVLPLEVEARGKVHYRVEELLQYHDVHFIENAYVALLERAPSDAERARELDELRSGRASKVEIVERLASRPEATGRGVRVEGLPSPVMRRLSHVPVVGYVLRLARALVRLPLLMEHQQQFEIYALAQQQILTDRVEQLSALPAQGNVVAVGAEAQGVQNSGSPVQADIIATVEMFSDALLDLSNGHAELQAQVQTQAEQVQSALTNLTQAVTTQQQITETLRREQHAAADAQQEFLIQEQRVIVETQKVVLEELREELRALSQRQQEARAQLEAELRRLQTLPDATATTAAATTTPREDFSGR